MAARVASGRFWMKWLANWTVRPAGGPLGDGVIARALRAPTV